MCANVVRKLKADTHGSELKKRIIEMSDFSVVFFFVPFSFYLFLSFARVDVDFKGTSR